MRSSLLLLPTSFNCEQRGADVLTLQQRIDKVMTLVPNAAREDVERAFAACESDFRDAQEDVAMQVGGLASSAPYALQLQRRINKATGHGVSRAFREELARLVGTPPNTHGGRRRNVIDRKIAAWIACQLMYRYGLDTQTSKGGRWNQIAALLHGNEEPESFEYACKVIRMNFEHFLVRETLSHSP